ncbi:hypothetical protein H0N95_03075 [Candidatus Micrarchaeota archaeon]|nr:hypothetical protein [Candidatus Micrarchaeota archaeon]
MRVSFDSGIVMTNGEHKLVLDPSRKTKDDGKTLVCVSHAHSDHVKRHEAPVLSTPQTADLFPYQINSTPAKYGRPVDFDGMTITQRSANHILGSSQFEITDGNETVVYTGDFRLNESLLFGKCDVPECDTLIVESTYGKPSFRFPLMKDVANDVGAWVKERSKAGRNLVFGSYSLGKSQEIISILNDMGVVPVVHSKIAHYSNVYNKHGHELAFVESGTSEGNKMLSNRFVAVMPQNLVDAGFISAMEEATGNYISAALLTGWGSMYNFSSKGIEKVFLMSDHADFYQILDYVKQSRAKRVLTVHGYESELAGYIQKKLGVDAKPLKCV